MSSEFTQLASVESRCKILFTLQGMTARNSKLTIALGFFGAIFVLQTMLLLGGGVSSKYGVSCDRDGVRRTGARLL